MIEDIKLKLLLLEIKIRLWFSSQVTKFIRKKYCANGWHKLKIGKLEIISKNKTKKVEYLTCQCCNYKFFATVKDRKKYEKLMDPKQNPLFDFLKFIKKEGSAGNPKKEEKK